MQKVLIIAIIALLQSVNGHTCIHDDIDHKPAKKTKVKYTSSRNLRRLQNEDEFKNLRFKWRLMDVHALSSIQLEYLEDVILPQATGYWSNTLQVNPVKEPFFYPICLSTWSTTPPICFQTSKEQTCSDEVTIPEDLLEPTRSCDGCLDEDGNGDICCFSNDSCGTCTQTGADPETGGVRDADFLVLINAVETARCHGSTVAYASTCLRDEEDRPIIGFVNICPSDFYRIPNSKQQEIDDVKVAIHELGHALGFSSSSFSLFRTKTGEYRVPQSYVDFECDSTTYSMVLPVGTVSSFDERGIDTSSCPYPKSSIQSIQKIPAFDEGHCILKLTTEAVVRETKKYFNCDSANGIELENRMGKDCQLVGSHLEQRLLNYDLMSSQPLEFGAAAISPITLAVFEDSGWYKVNYEAGVIQPTKKSWGKGMGCKFLTEKCINDEGSSLDNDHFCVDESINKCMIGRLHKGLCNILDFGDDIAPPHYQYFSSIPNRGGRNVATDFCPIIASQGASGNCRFGSVATENYGGEIYSENSLCFESSLRIIIGTRTLAPGSRSSCYKVVECKKVGDKYESYIVEIRNDVRKSNHNVTCTTADDGRVKSVEHFEGHITCAPVDEICTVAAATVLPTNLKGSQNSDLSGASALFPNISLIALYVLVLIN